MQRSDGKYETSLPCKQCHATLPKNYVLAKSRFNALMKKLKNQPDFLEAYHEIIVNQLKEVIIEKAPEKPTGIEHYISHKGVMRESQQHFTLIERMFGDWATASKKHSRYSFEGSTSNDSKDL